MFICTTGLKIQYSLGQISNMPLVFFVIVIELCSTQEQTVVSGVMEGSGL